MTIDRKSDVETTREPEASKFGWQAVVGFLVYLFLPPVVDSICAASIYRLYLAKRDLSNSYHTKEIKCQIC